MLQTLHIKNLALIESILWEVPIGFTALTGETGAGKSIVIDAISLVLGERADKTLIRSGTESATVEAVWDLATNPDLLKTINHLLEKSGVEPCEEGVLTMKRSLLANGQNRQFINHSAVSLQLLKQIGDHLADMHGPHDHQSLLSNDTQRELLDAYGHLDSFTSSTQQTWQCWNNAVKTYEQLKQEIQTSDQEISLLTFQVEEIEKAHLQENEEEILAPQMDRIHNFQKLLQLTQQLQIILDENENSAINQLGQAERLLSQLITLDGETQNLQDYAHTAQSALQEWARELSSYQDRLDLDPQQAAEMESRYNLIQSLKRKYGGSLIEVLTRAREGRERLNRITKRDEILEKSQKEMKETEVTYRASAKKLSQARKKASEKLSQAITKQLQELGFKKALFTVTSTPTDHPASHGLDAIEFLFAPNMGEGEKPLRAIASSGEMARVMLAIKTSLAEQDQVPLLIFDEVDANVGGEIGTRVGQKLKALSAHHQIFCITHLPQVAALGNQHIAISKQTRQQRTVTELQVLNDKERIEELARMLGGSHASSRALAEALLKA
ncbi:MAG: DNA repair protein RecN [Verrucomicrobiae bacterium]|nr:DNA repair protein RecN [Verrucomicrobiae bacterium]